MKELIQFADLSPYPAQPGATRAYHAMVKPVGAICNIDCTYCYYLHKKELLGSESKFQISDEILETHIRQYIEGQDRDQVVFSWQGGEPTLLGLEFFHKVVELEQKYKKPNQRIENDLQTNGTLLDDEWGAFLKQHSFLVGLSIDGPQELHDVYRIANDGKPTFEKVFAASRHAASPRRAVQHVDGCKSRQCQAAARCLSLPEERSAATADAVHSLRRAQGVPQRAPQKWDPATLPLFDSPAAHPGNPDSVVTDWSIDPDDWGYFLCKVWDDWYRRDIGKVFVNLFETAVAQWMGKESQLCIYHEFCGKGVALEHDGSLYSCDHYVYPEYKLGNIMQTSSSRMVFSEQQKKFGFAKFNTLPTRCRECKYLFACNGECPKNRLIRTPDGEPGLNYLCSGLQKFWHHIDQDAQDICRRIARGEELRMH